MSKWEDTTVDINDFYKSLEEDAMDGLEEYEMELIADLEKELKENE